MNTLLLFTGNLKKIFKRKAKTLLAFFIKQKRGSKEIILDTFYIVILMCCAPQWSVALVRVS